MEYGVHIDRRNFSLADRDSKTIFIFFTFRWVPSGLIGSALFDGDSHVEVKRGHEQDPLISSGAITVAMWVRHDVSVDDEAVLLVGE